MKVLSVSSECVPLVKTGGLADVAGALPAALAGVGVSVRTLLPGYPAVLSALEGSDVALAEPDLFGGAAQVRVGTAAGLDLAVLDAPHLFDRGATPYLGPDGADWPDNPERFGALSWIAAEIGAQGLSGWQPDVLHLHDWQAGLAPVYLRHTFGADDRVKTVFTVHNIAFHGPAPRTKLEALRLPSAEYTPKGFEFYGRISALKAGLVYSDRLTTVSPTYARELMTPEFGMGLDGVLRARMGALSGILNGIDETAWNPATDPHIEQTFTTLSGKAVNRTALIAEFGLDPEAPGPLCVVVTRLTEQKGLDLLQQALPALMAQGGQLAMLGSGDPGLEAAFVHAAASNPRMSVKLGYDEALSHRLIAGGDAILVPSRFEPCGLTQLYGLRYGTIPVVTLTGGLADTVIHANAAALSAGVATGLQAHPITAESLAEALTTLGRLFAQPRVWQTMVQRAMAQPVGWGPSAEAYAALYREIAPTAGDTEGRQEAGDPKEGAALLEEAGAPEASDQEAASTTPDETNAPKGRSRGAAPAVR